MAAIVMLPFVLKGLKTSYYLSRDRLSIQQFDYHRKKVVAGGIVCGLIMTFASTFQSLGLAYSVLVPSALGYACQMAGQKHASPTSAALILSLESVFSVLSGALILHERMLTREILGCILIFAAVIANQVNLADIRKKASNGDGSH